MEEFASELIGKPLLSRNGERIGYVKNIQTDKKLVRIRNLECCDEDEEEFILPVSAIAQLGKDAAIVKSLSAAGCKNCISAPFGIEVFSETGDKLGTLADFVRENFVITHYILSDGQKVPADRLVSAADSAIVDLSGTAVRRPPRAAKKRTARALPQISEGNGADAEEQTAGTAATATATESDYEVLIAEEANFEQTPAAQEVRFSRPSAHKMAGSALLTGKTLPAPLVDARGNVIAAAGATVTPDIIRRALAHNKLFALTLLCTEQYR